MNEEVVPRARNLFLDALDAQEAKGLRDYGLPLTTFNGRNAAAMCREELVDANNYLTQLELEHETLKRFLREVEAYIRDGGFINLTEFQGLRTKVLGRDL